MRKTESLSWGTNQLLLLCAILLCCLLTPGCGGSGSSKEAPAAPTTVEIAEPRLVKDIGPGYAPGDVTLLTPFQGKLYFFAGRYSPGSGRQLWVSDGTPAGTVEITHEPIERYTFLYLREMVATEKYLFFSMEPGELWVSDGTAEGTGVLLGLVGLQNLAVVDDNLFFTALGNQLWRTDGTPDGTFLVKTINPDGFAYPSTLTVVGNRLFFTADDGIHGKELWVSDGTPEGTVLVKDISPANGDSNPHNFKGNGNLLYFTADDGLHGLEPWRSDGTAEGTWMIADICEGDCGSIPTGFVEFEDQVFFRAFNQEPGFRLWHASGEDSDAKMLRKDGIAFASCNEILPFIGIDDEYGYELWRTDGTDEGTALIKDINPGGWSSSPNGLACFHNQFYFSAYNPGMVGAELMVSDGTTDGTYLLKDISPPTDEFLCGNYSSEPASFTMVGGDQLFFTAENCTSGRELWVMEAIRSDR